MDLLTKIKSSIEKAIEHLRAEIGKLRTGRASSALVEDIKVSYYGQTLPLKQIATINTPQSNVIIIQPWDKNAIANISKSISESGIGINPIVDGESIRLAVPPLNEERRKEFVKILKEKLEEARVSIRRHREDVWKEIQKEEDSGEISEDDKFKLKEDLQKIVDDYNEKIEEIGEVKEKELMEN